LIYCEKKKNCYVIGGDRGRWIGIDGAVADGFDGLNSTHATVPAGRYCSQEAAVRAREEARVLGAMNASRGVCPRPAREKGFPSNLLLDFRLIHLLSLYRDVYLTPKQATN